MKTFILVISALAPTVKSLGKGVWERILGQKEFPPISLLFYS
jgi:hypothetical protein